MIREYPDGVYETGYSTDAARRLARETAARTGHDVYLYCGCGPSMTIVEGRWNAFDHPVEIIHPDGTSTVPPRLGFRALKMHGPGGAHMTGDDLFIALRRAIDLLQAEEPGGASMDAIGVVITNCAHCAELLLEARNALRESKGLPPIVIPCPERIEHE